eukprot:gnl/TRDRNA2_/TRDRNA2_161395_c0_seq1.p1 gnl/TRDRNA2_/TRDRNA2_161395_c0~~gnl/TRDRNA2_/TRDRNA2_161395_c0_seq1.p1  ORF type:complete len:376 (-),score=75.12 gnl/TRDRNA2_/TRDRNA2_161395_c0_seq1:162-1289(-)
MFLQLKNSTLDEESYRWKRVWAVYSVALSAALLAFCEIVLGGVSLPRISREHAVLRERTSTAAQASREMQLISQRPARRFLQSAKAESRRLRQLTRTSNVPRLTKARHFMQQARIRHFVRPAALDAAVPQHLTAPSTVASETRHAPGTPGASPGDTVRALYTAFNERNATATGELLADDCVYEDLLLGPATVCRGRRAFEAALRWHPAFLGTTLARVLPEPFARRLPNLTLVVDSVAEDLVRGIVGVEWHVAFESVQADSKVASTPFPLGRGLSHAKVDLATGKIERVVDIAEAPWRVVGLLVSPFIATAATLQTEVFRAAALIAARRGTEEDNDADAQESSPCPKLQEQAVLTADQLEAMMSKTRQQEQQRLVK